MVEPTGFDCRGRIAEKGESRQSSEGLGRQLSVAALRRRIWGQPAETSEWYLLKAGGPAGLLAIGAVILAANSRRPAVSDASENFMRRFAIFSLHVSYASANKGSNPTPGVCRDAIDSSARDWYRAQRAPALAGPDDSTTERHCPANRLTGGQAGRRRRARASAALCRRRRSDQLTVRDVHRKRRQTQPPIAVVPLVTAATPGCSSATAATAPTAEQAATRGCFIGNGGAGGNGANGLAGVDGGPGQDGTDGGPGGAGGDGGAGGMFFGNGGRGGSGGVGGIGGDGGIGPNGLSANTSGADGERGQQRAPTAVTAARAATPAPAARPDSSAPRD